MTAPIYGLTHIALKVRDLDHTVGFYEQVFGVKPYFRDDRTVQVLGPGPHDVLAFEKADEMVGVSGGIIHFGFRLTSPEALEAVLSKAVAAGAEITDRGDFGGSQVFAFIRDPNGYEIELWYEHTAPHAQG
jgi:catechol 2,3-dioxygenase-like lactoylglutathione lyase family enzyme